MAFLRLYGPEEEFTTTANARHGETYTECTVRLLRPQRTGPKRSIQMDPQHGPTLNWKDSRDIRC
eukprot:13554-Amphidinium_carterae.2